MSQVNGMVLVIDATGYSMKHQSYMTIEDRRKMLNIWQVYSNILLYFV